MNIKIEVLDIFNAWINQLALQRVNLYDILPIALTLANILTQIGLLKRGQSKGI